jgi:UDP-N-acetylglucosamine 2-epimerase (non-hydrolysing)
MNKKQKVLTVFGTRPSAIKMAPIVHALQDSEHHESVVCLSGQHREMLTQVTKLFNVKADYNLDVMTDNQTLASITSKVITGLQNVIEQERPDWILVQGDTTTCLAGALAGFYNKVKVGHVEAGLRTYNLSEPYPEEVNRQLVSRIADLHFVPTELAAKHLLDENIEPSKIIKTGNTVIDALLWVEKRVDWQLHWADSFSTAVDVIKQEAPYILVTAHRRENQGQGFIDICNALVELAKKYPHWHIIYPVHLNPNVQKPVFEMLSGVSSIHLIEPQDYEPFVYLMKHCKIVLTDSGGVQEEAPSLAKPVLVMRNTTERQEGVEAGTSKLVGNISENIVNEVSLLIDDANEYDKMAKAVNPYGDGQASQMIVNELKSVS